MPNCYLYAHHLFGPLAEQKQLLLKQADGDWEQRLLFYEARYDVTLSWSRRPVASDMRRRLGIGDRLVVISPWCVSGKLEGYRDFARLIEYTFVDVRCATNIKPTGKGQKVEPDKFGRSRLEAIIEGMAKCEGKTPREIALELQKFWSVIVKTKKKCYLAHTVGWEDNARELASKLKGKPRVVQGVPWYSGKPYTTVLVRKILNRLKAEQPVVI